MNSGLKLKIISLFDNVINNGIGVNEEGKALVFPSLFSTKGNQEYNYLMNMVPNYKLPSFQLGIIEVVTAVAHAAVASNLVTYISQLKKNLILIVDVCSVAPGWINTHYVFFNTALLQPAVIGRMVYEIKCVTKHLQKIFNRKISETHLCATRF